MARRRKKPSEQVHPSEVREGEFYAVDGVRFKCIGNPRPGPDRDFDYIPSRMAFLGLFLAKEMRPVRKTNKVDVFRD